MMPRPLAPHLSAPPLAYAGERTALLAEREELLAKRRRNAPGSPNCRAIHKRLVTITARLMALGVEPPPAPGNDRKDLQ